MIRVVNFLDSKSRTKKAQELRLQTVTKFASVQTANITHDKPPELQRVCNYNVYIIKTCM